MTAVDDTSGPGRVVVGRLGALIAEQSSEWGDAVATLAIFSTLLTWVLHHSRIREGEIETDLDHAAYELGAELRATSAASPPWSLSDQQIVPCALPFAFPRLSVEAVMVGLRNALAHGDARTVQPVYRIGGGRIVGFRFGPCTHIETKAASARHNWLLTLGIADMVRLGVLLADRYCAEASA